MQEHYELTVLVTGARGRQGGAVARRLLDRGHRVRALTRAPSSSSADELRRLGADVRAGSFDDPEALRRAMHGVDAVFLMSTPSADGAATELRQACAVIDAARSACVTHVVLSSVLGASHPSGVSDVESKRRIEDYLGASSLGFTVVRPAYFMENALAPGATGARQGCFLELPLTASARVPQVALLDLGTFVAYVMERRRGFLGRAVDVASDVVTGPELARAISAAAGRRVEYRQRVDERGGLAGGEALVRWLEEAAPLVDVAALRRDFPEVGWRRASDWAWEQRWHLDGE